jgi:hypothetical protein
VTWISAALGLLILAGIVIDVQLWILQKRARRMVTDIERRDRQSAQREYDADALFEAARVFYAEANRRWTGLLRHERRVH